MRERKREREREERREERREIHATWLTILSPSVAVTLVIMEFTGVFSSMVWGYEATLVNCGVNWSRYTFTVKVTVAVAVLGGEPPSRTPMRICKQTWSNCIPFRLQQNKATSRTVQLVFGFKMSYQTAYGHLTTKSHKTKFCHNSSD